MGDPVESLPPAELVASTTWYQTLKLPGGLVTPGHFDTLDELERVPFPSSLKGKRCLDIGTANGFWAFEMERRGADEVLAIDLDHPRRLDWPGVPKSDEQMHAAEGSSVDTVDTFLMAHEAIGSGVERRVVSIYELSPEQLGQFDFVFMGSLLLHLRDPVGALVAVRSVLRGDVLSVDAISPLLTVMHPKQPVARLEAPGWPLWWVLNLAAYRRLFPSAGLEITATGRPFVVRRGVGFTPSPRAGHRLVARARQLGAERWGVPHAWVQARPSAS